MHVASGKKAQDYTKLSITNPQVDDRLSKASAGPPPEQNFFRALTMKKEDQEQSSEYGSSSGSSRRMSRMPKISIDETSPSRNARH